MTGIKKEDCMSRLNIALLQIRPGDCTEQNLEIGIRGCRKAKELGIPILTEEQFLQMLEQGDVRAL